MQECDVLIPCKRSLWLGMKETVAAVNVTQANSASARRAVTCPSAHVKHHECCYIIKVAIDTIADQVTVGIPVLVANWVSSHRKAFYSIQPSDNI